jgi:phosphoglycerate dehydrogenase-like enzyme
MLILVSDAFDPSLPNQLARFGEVTEDKDRLPEADVVLVRSKTKVRADYLQRAPNLKLIIRGGVGLDSIDVATARQRGIVVRNTAEASTTAVAELAFALMLGITSHLARADASMRQGQWLKKELQRTELYGKTLGIVGLGRIGLALAARARAFNMRVLGWHPDVNFTDFAEIYGDLDALLRDSDYVSLHAPLLPDTRGLINHDRLHAFKDGAILINTARAAIVVEDDIVEALASGKLGGYASDVWPADPPPASPLMEAPNTLFTPHIGASTQENMRRIGLMIERLLDEFVAGKLQA